MTKEIGAILILAVLVVGGFAGLMTAKTASATVIFDRCPVIPVNLRIGATDYFFGGQVSVLQDFLRQEGYFSGATTGLFGPLTFAATVRYQKANGIPATGYVGPTTRASFQNRDCGMVPPKQGPVLYSLSPASGSIGTNVYISGQGFSGTNTILLDGSVVAEVSSNALSFVVPEYISPRCAPGMYCIMLARQVMPGPHTVTVENQNGTSNALTFTVTEKNIPTNPLSISGIDAPSVISIGEQATWTVRVQGRSDMGTLHYSVVWGDENAGKMSSGIMAPQPTPMQTSATFTHYYMYMGTYTPKFTVTDDYGRSVSASATVTVTPVYVY